MIVRIDTCEGKYTWELTGTLRCLRYGEPWRDFVGDKAVYSLFRELEEAKALAEQHYYDTITGGLEDAV